MAATVQKWGNSLGIRIPKAIAQQVELEEGTSVQFEAAKGMLTIRPQPSRRKYKLADLLAQMKPRHRRGELDKSGPRGGELL
ncbi:MAG TPA: AbrB/MazE/SpoVT family DNA-binding domain-containing protein [Tepidisphaeraceae bacterium]|jgi:antitoxin MazE